MKNDKISNFGHYIWFFRRRIAYKWGTNIHAGALPIVLCPQTCYSSRYNTIWSHFICSSWIHWLGIGIGTHWHARNCPLYMLNSVSMYQNIILIGETQITSYWTRFRKQTMSEQCLNHSEYFLDVVSCRLVNAVRMLWPGPKCSIDPLKWMQVRY